MTTGTVVKTTHPGPQAHFIHEDILIDGAIGFTSTQAGPMFEPSEDQSAIMIPTLVRVRSADGVPIEELSARNFSAAFWDNAALTKVKVLTCDSMHTKTGPTTDAGISVLGMYSLLLKMPELWWWKTPDNKRNITNLVFILNVSILDTRAGIIVSKSGQVFLTAPCLHMPRVYNEADDA
ncbi:hypothetical protein AB4Y44_39800 [Paraburkholderia sp. BR10937]|uniref:hypothetical protein n=1 Tax=Paraburkholderia sp. BR10937 TaxID=3236994 RepID=UPI0034D17AFB